MPADERDVPGALACRTCSEVVFGSKPLITIPGGLSAMAWLNAFCPGGFSVTLKSPRKDLG